MTDTQHKQPDGTGVCEIDPWLSPYKDVLRERCVYILR
jgi:hypothetical protein